MLIHNIPILPATILSILSFFGAPQKLPTFLTYLRSFGYTENPTNTESLEYTYSRVHEEDVRSKKE